MRRVAVTGHVILSREQEALIPDAVISLLRQWAGAGLHGITCMALGADQIFARAIVAIPGTFEVVLPARDYQQAMWAAGDGEAFDALLEQAVGVDVMPFERSSREAYLAASRAMLDRCDVLVAIWDGTPSRRVGDTAHVVALARERDLPVTVLWPAHGEPQQPTGAGALPAVS